MNTKMLTRQVFILSTALSLSACQLMTGPLDLGVPLQLLQPNTQTTPQQSTQNQPGHQVPDQPALPPSFTFNPSINIPINNNFQQTNNNHNQQTINISNQQFQTTSQDVSGILTAAHLLNLSQPSQEQLQQALDQTQGKVIEQTPEQVTIELPAEQSPKQTAQELEDRGIAASPVYVFEAQVIRDEQANVAFAARADQNGFATQDPHWSDQNNSWGQQMIRQPEAIKQFAVPITTVTGEMEFGIESHPDLPAIQQHGQNFDDVDHGNHVAGILSAVSNNQIGLAGIAPLNSFQAVTICKTMTCMSNGIRTAADKGIKVVNISLGVSLQDPVSDQDLQKMVSDLRKIFDPAVSYAASRGTLLFVAAGNGVKSRFPGFASRAIDSSLTMPSALAAHFDNVISVAAVDPQGAKTSFSNFGSSVTIAAPGYNIYSSIDKGRYARYSGTSMAAPMVSGAVSWLLSRHPQLTPIQVKQLLRESAQPVPGQAFGRMDLVALMNLAEQRYGQRPPVQQPPVQQPPQPPVQQPPVQQPPQPPVQQPAYKYQVLDPVAPQGWGTWGDIFISTWHLEGDELVATVKKRDGSPFKNKTNFYLKVGSPEVFGVDHATLSLDPGRTGAVYQVTLRSQLSRLQAFWEPHKEFWLRAENAEGVVISGGVRVKRLL